MKRWYSRKPLMILLAVVLLAGSYPLIGWAEKDDGKRTEAASAQTELAAEPAEEATALESSGATEKMLENAQFELYVNEQTGNVRIVSKSTGVEWLGEPRLPKTALPTEKKFVQSPVHLKYTEGVDVTSLYSLKDPETTFSIRAGTDVVRVDFDFSKAKLKLALEYRLTERGLEVTIPDDSLKEEGTARFISIEPLPFMNSARETDDGGMVLPDGSGALLEFREQHPQYLKGYSEPIYGADLAFLTKSNKEVYDMGTYALNPKEKIALPIFGMYKDGVGTLGVVTEGAEEALINGTPAGIRNIAQYRSSAEFVYRKDDVIFIGTSGKIPFYQGNRVTGDRKLEYLLVEGDQANYVGLAQAYRRYLTEVVGIKPADNQRATLQISLLGGILQDEIIGSTFIKMTTFEQAKDIIDSYAAKGISSLELTLEGWSHDGLYGDSPEHFPIEKKLGGTDGLKELAAYAKQKGIALYLAANYVRPFSGSDGMNKKKDAIRGMDREVLDVYNHYVSNGWRKRDEKFYLLKPQRVLEKHVLKESGSFAKLGVAGVQLMYMGDSTYSDLDPKSLASRSQTVAAWTRAMDEMKIKVGSASVDYGFAYALGRVDRITGAPLDSSRFVYTDRTIPFYSIVVHGLVPYSASPYNLADDSRAEWLRMIEYGATPSFRLTSEATSKLQRTIENGLISSQASDWLDESARLYEQVESLNESVAGAAIANHEELGKQVYRTTYENGVSVIVNYNKEAVSAGGSQVPGYGFAVEGAAP